MFGAVLYRLFLTSIVDLLIRDGLLTFDLPLQPLYPMVKGLGIQPQPFRRFRVAAEGIQQAFIDGQLLPAEVQVEGVSSAQLAGVADDVSVLLRGDAGDRVFRRWFLFKPDLAPHLGGGDSAAARGAQLQSFDRRFKLPDISGPVIAAEQGEGVLFHLQGTEKMTDEKRYVGWTFPERRHSNGKLVEAVIEILAEATLFDFAKEILVGRGDHPHIDFPLGVRADGENRPLLQDPQEIPLEVHGHFADLIEEDRPPAGGLEEPALSAGRAGERAFDVAEEPRFEQGFRHGAAVDRFEGASCAAAVAVNGAGHQFLAGAGFAGDEDRDVVPGGEQDVRFDIAHRLRITQQEVVIRRGAPLPPVVMRSRQRHILRVNPPQMGDE